MTTTTEGRELNLQDRCDYCGAAAKVVSTLITGELMFCGHHARDMKENLLLKSISVYDPEGELTLV